MRVFCMGITLAIASATASAQPAVQANDSVQNAFDAANAALDAKDWTTALERYVLVESRLMKGKRNARSLGTVRLRKGVALYWLRRDQDSAAAIQQGLETLPQDDPVMRQEIAQGLQMLGRIAVRAFDYPAAIAHFAKAVSYTTGDGEHASALLELARYAIWADRAVAAKTLDEIGAIIRRTPSANKSWLGLLHQYRGRLLLNQGRIREARSAYDDSIHSYGGLYSGKIDMLDSSVRSDAAIAALRDGDEEAARRYLVYAGAAMQSGLGFERGRDMDPPDCGGPLNLQPEDVAVIELAIGELGEVISAEPVFFSGSVEKAHAYAKAVGNWSWSADELKKVGPFFRQQSRIELRCTRAFSRPSPELALTPALDAWLEKMEGVSLPDFPESRALANHAMMAELKRREIAHGPDSPKLLALLYKLANDPITGQYEAGEFAARGRAIARSAKAPPKARLLFEITHLSKMRPATALLASQAREAELVALRSDPEIRADNAASATLLLWIYDYLPANRRRDEGIPLLRSIVDDKGLDEKEPVRAGALVRLANLSFASGQVEEARSFFDRSGLTGQQCALVNVQPKQTGGLIADRDYPNDAIRWGMGGWTTIEFDIRADGTPENVRPVIAFPPFVFGKSTVEQFWGFRYEPTYRPAGWTGCGSRRQHVTYRFKPRR